MWIKTRSDRIKVRSDRIKMRSKGDQNAEQGGAKHGARWSKGYVFLFDSKLESCLEASSFKYRNYRDIRKKDYTNKMKS